MIDILVPTLDRPISAARLAENVAGSTRLEHRCLFICDAADMQTRDALRAVGAEFTVSDGTYPEKIAAGYSLTGNALVLPTADDVVFHDDWLELVLAALDDDVMAVGTNDLTPSTENRKHATMPVVRRSYCEDPGAAWAERGSVFWTGYHHNFCETELWQLARSRGVTGWSDAVIEHLHPSWGTRDADGTDARGWQHGWKEDRAKFDARRARWTAS